MGPLLEQSDSSDTEIISVEECQKYLKRYKLSDQTILNIKDNLIGIVDSVFNSYLEEFK